MQSVCELTFINNLNYRKYLIEALIILYHTRCISRRIRRTSCAVFC